MIAAALLVASAVAVPVPLQDPEPQLRPGIWRAWLDSPGGELPFQLELRGAADALSAVIHNGTERIPFPVVELEAGQLRLGLPHYDATLAATLDRAGERLDGQWIKRGSGDSWTRMDFHATFCVEGLGLASAYRDHCRFTPGKWWGPADFRGRWRVAFESSAEPAVAIFEGGAFEFRGTILTTLGDYRYLAGNVRDGELRLSCFDGAHAFLFRATHTASSELAGDFWSRDTWHETWTAVRDDAARLPDAFELTRWNAEVPLASLSYPDLDGVERSLGDQAFAGQARLLQVFGSWCPNCNDEAPYLAELDRRYRARGLSVLGLAFEHSGDFERDAEQLRRYAALHGIEFPLLLAGTSDKRAASERFPLIDRIKAFPTTLFLRADGSVRAIHTGFSGPATGDAHAKLRADFERLIEELLADAERETNER